MRPSKSFKLPFGARGFEWSKTQEYLYIVDSNKMVHTLDTRGNFFATGLKGDRLFSGPNDELIVAFDKAVYAYNQETSLRYSDIELADRPTRVDFGRCPFTAVVWDESGGSSVIDFDSGTQLFEKDEDFDTDRYSHDGYQISELTGDGWADLHVDRLEESEPLDLDRWAGVLEQHPARQVELVDGSLSVKTKSHEFRIESPSGKEFVHYDYAETGKFGVIAAEDHGGGIHVFNASAPSESIQLLDGSGITQTALIGFDFSAKCLAVHVWSLDGESVKIWTAARIEKLISKNLSIYRNAKVVLAGDTGVGKSGLFLRLLGQEYGPTESTHSRNVERLASSNYLDNETREVFLWDLAGQPGYRIMHQLSLRDVSVGLVVFDSRDESTSLRSLSFWGQALLSSGSPLKAPQTLLVSARCDRGVPMLSPSDLDELNLKFPIVSVHNTSAKEDDGVDALREEIFNQISWEDCPAVVAPQSFFEIRDRLLEYKSSAQMSFIAEENLVSAIGGNESEASRAVISLSLKRLEASGALVKLVQRDLWLLEPELLDSIVSSMAIAARNDPDGLGRVSLDDLSNGQFIHAQLENPIDEQLLLDSAIVELVARRLACRVDTDAGPVLVFPTAQRLGMSTEVDVSDYYCSVSFSGPVSIIYSAATIRLMATMEFGGDVELYRNSVRFPVDGGGSCGYSLEFRDDDTSGVLKCYFSADVSLRSRARFVTILRSQVEKFSNRKSSTLDRLYFHCGVEISDAVVLKAENSGRECVYCSSCGERVELVSLETTGKDRAWVEIADREHDRNKRREIRLLKRDANLKKRLFQTFVCYNTVDRPSAVRVYNELLDLGVVPWMDIKSDLNSSNAVRRIDQLVSTVPSALICLGPSSLGKFQEHEYHSFLHRSVYDDGEGSKFRLAVVLLPGVDAAAMPALLKPIERFDLSRSNAEELDRLADFIDGPI